MSTREIKSARILLIEDEPEMVSAVRRVLQVTGYKVLWAFNGPDGIAIAKRESIDLIILDVNMPKMSGYEVMKIIQENNKTKHVPVVLFSGSVQESEIQKGLSLGAIGYIRKPFNPDTLLEEVSKYLQKTVQKPILSEEPDEGIDEQLQRDYFIRLQKKLTKFAILLENNEFDEIAVMGHHLTASGASYGFRIISDIGSEIEDAGDSRDIKSLKRLHNSLSKAIAAIINRKQGI